MLIGRHNKVQDAPELTAQKLDRVRLAPARKPNLLLAYAPEKSVLVITVERCLPLGCGTWVARRSGTRRQKGAVACTQSTGMLQSSARAEEALPGSAGRRIPASGEQKGTEGAFAFALPFVIASVERETNSWNNEGDGGERAGQEGDGSERAGQERGAHRSTSRTASRPVPTNPPSACAMCIGHRASCIVQCAVCSVRRATCDVRRAVSQVRRAMCNVRCAMYDVHGRGSKRCAPCRQQSALGLGVVRFWQPP